MEVTNSTDSVNGAAETELECQKQGLMSAMLCPTTFDKHVGGSAVGPFCKYAQVVDSSATVKCNSGADAAR